MVDNRIRVSLQPVREIYIKIDLLENRFEEESGFQIRKFIKIAELEGVATSGSISLDGSSTHRRTGNIGLIVKDDSYLVGEDKKIWLDKWVKIFVGIKDLTSDSIVWFNLGTMVVDAPSVSYSPDSRELVITLLDRMSTIDGTYGGYLLSPTKLSAGTPFNDAIKSTLRHYGRISTSSIYTGSNTYTLPYDLDFSPNDTAASVVEQIRDLQLDWETYFDEEGRFIFKQKNNLFGIYNAFDSNPLSYNFLQENKIINSIRAEYNFQNVRNKIKVIGGIDQLGNMYTSTLENTNPQSPFNIYGNFGVVEMVYQDEKILTQVQADLRAEYELFKKTNLNERITIDGLPLYYLQPNTIIKVNLPNLNIVGFYNIDKINFTLGVDEKMNLSAYKLYEE